MILGLDVGSDSTKSYDGKNYKSFKSTVKEGYYDFAEGIKVEYEGKKYTIGSVDGSSEASIDKNNSEISKLCLYTSIALNMRGNNQDVKLVVGLPIQYYDVQKNELKALLEGKNITITVNNNTKTFTISKVIVFPQGAGLFVIEPTLFVGDSLVIDIGGYTVDVAVFRGRNLIKTKTYELGIHKLYDNLAQEIKSKYMVSYDTLEMESKIENKIIYKDGIAININELIYNTMESHLKKIISDIKKGLNEYDNSKRIWCGGGSDLLKAFIPMTDTIAKDVFFNAEVFYKIGAKKFES